MARKYDLRASTSSRGIACDRGAPPLNKSLFFIAFFLPRLHLSLLLDIQCPPKDKNKSHVYCLAVSRLLFSPSSSSMFAEKVITSQRSISNVHLIING